MAETERGSERPDFADDVTDFVEQHGYTLTDWQKRYLRAQFHSQEADLRRRSAGAADHPLIPSASDPWLSQPERRGSYWETMPGIATIAAAVGLLIVAAHALFGPDGVCR